MNRAKWITALPFAHESDACFDLRSRDPLRILEQQTIDSFLWHSFKQEIYKTIWMETWNDSTLTRISSQCIRFWSIKMIQMSLVWTILRWRNIFQLLLEGPSSPQRPFLAFRVFGKVGDNRINVNWPFASEYSLLLLHTSRKLWSLRYTK